MDSDIILVIVVATALVFDFTNGFHDAANAVATSISTRALAPKTAVTLSAILNFAGAFISLEVAATVAGGIVDAGLVTTTVIFAGLIGAIFWNVLTWYFGLPSSSSHALIGGVVGAAFAAAGADAVLVGGLLEKVMVPALVAPLVAFAAAGACILITYRLVGRLRPGAVDGGYRLGQIASASLLSLS
ncbi:MAG: inorganic phosphate transporter, partial [Actinobacteria bacterium]|nr:inorganic phosphate transporter [Actinomycetota bacterium]